MISRIYFIRHGITEGNDRKWFYGKADLPLTAEGKETLKKFRDRGIYPDIPDDAGCYTSALSRTDETFQIIYGDRARKPLPLLNEMQFGEYECKTYEELKGYEGFHDWAYDETGDVKLPGGESRNEFAARVSKGLKELVNLHRMKEWSHRHGGQDAITVMVCHGGVISAIMQELFPQVNGSMWDWMPDPGLGYMVEFEGGEPSMYEKITDIKKLGFGFMRLPEKNGEIDMDMTKAMVDRFMDRGYTYFDTAYAYNAGKSEEAIKTALVDRYPRDSFQLATKLPAFSAKTEEEAKAMFDTSLARTGAGYFDFYLLHNLDDEKLASFDKFHMWDFLKEKKAEGKIVKAGFSFHGKAEGLAKILDDHPEVDFVQLQINYLDWEDPEVESRKCYDVARNHFKPIIIMEPVKGGNLSDFSGEARDVLTAAAPDASLASWAMRYAMGLTGVITVLSGMSDMDQLEDNLATADNYKPLTEEEKKALNKAAEILHSLPGIPCTGCRYCVAGCPSSIDIPGIMDCMNQVVRYNNAHGAANSYYWTIMGAGKATDCIQCGKCEEACPQHIKIVDYMTRAADIFDK
ncbi:aldo/keto reductase [Aminicella lysinilytica]|uniref:Putative aldo/keto reductase-like oxidoreductase n=1 Tax=Aminicella lysinilytica TaxID=433323 RepID=A0A4R6PZS1_9FIRM|nr:putative aldo/keto reductase-like oxidoreductase [Aminicella lysinilytica]